MKITDRIAAAEAEFYSENVHEPRFLIMSFYSLLELLDELKEEGKFVYEFPEDLEEYYGLVIATTTNPKVEDFKLA